MRDKINGKYIKFIYGKKSKNIRGKFKANKENSRNISKVGIIDFDNIFWFKPKIMKYWQNENSKRAERKKENKTEDNLKM